MWVGGRIEGCDIITGRKRETMIMQKISTKSGFDVREALRYATRKSSGGMWEDSRPMNREG